LAAVKRTEEIRADFPALQEGFIHLDGPAGTQTPTPVIDAVSRAMGSALANAGGRFPAAERTDAVVADARGALADLLGVDPAGVVLGPNMTTLTFRFAETLSRSWEAGDEIVLTRLDHDANVRPWAIAAERREVRVRWADFDPETCELALDQWDDLLGPRTRLVAVTAAANAVGTRPDVAAIADAGHAVEALVFVDAVHAAPHTPLDASALGADLIACSAYKFFGPHVGTVAGRPELLERLRPDKLVPSSDAVPWRFERGTPAFELLAGVTACVDYLADLTPGDGERRARVLATMAEIEAREEELFADLLAALRAIDGVTVYGGAARRTPTLSFTVAGSDPGTIAAELGVAGINVWNGNYYAYEFSRRAGLEDSGGAVRVGLAPYTTPEEIDRFRIEVERLATR
jgi:cysteine desulfurase family protein (TIGR01976 family)